MINHIKRFAACCAVFLAGCAASGVKVSEDQLAQFKPGTTSEAEVMSALGPPNMRMRLQDGSTMLVYSYFEYTTRASTFIPVVGAFAGGADYKSSSVTLTFDSSGKFKSYSSTESSNGTASGATSGISAPISTDQPRKPE